MTSDQLTAIRREIEGAMAVRDAATAGPWRYNGNDGHNFTVVAGKSRFAVCSLFGTGAELTANGRFIERARTDPTHAHALALLDEVERLNDELAKLKCGAK